MQTSAFTLRLLFTLGLAALLLGLGAAPTATLHGEDRNADRAPGDIARELNNPTHVGEEPDFAQSLEQARRLEVRERYDDALDAYMRLIAQADRWQYDPPGGQEPHTPMAAWEEVPRAHGEGYYGQSFKPLREVCLRRINELPATYRNRYRDRVRPEAQQLWREALETRERRLVQRVADEYWPARVGPEAMDLAARLAFEAADFQSAAYYWERMLEFAQASFAREPIRIVQLAATYYALGDMAGFDETVREARRRYDGYSVTVGRERYANLVELLEPEKLAERFLAHTPWIEPRGLTHPRGNNQGTRPAPHFQRLTHVHPPVDLTPFFQANDNQRNMQRFHMQQMRGGNPRAQRNLFTLSPAVYDGRLAVHGPLQMYLLDLAEGDRGSTAVQRRFVGNISRLLPSTPDAQQDPRGVIRMRTTEPQTYAPVIYRDNIYTVYQPGNLQTDARSQRPGDVLACYPLGSQGAVRWVTPTNAHDVNESHSDFLQSLTLSPAPATGGGNIYVAARHHSEQEMGYFAIAYDADTGEVQWYQRVATRLAETSRFRGSAPATGALAPPIYDGGMLFVQTNAGAVSALDALTGTIRWTFKYKRREGTQPRGGVVINDDDEAGWANNAPISHRGVTYFAPMDSKRLLVMLGRTGDFLRQFPSTDREVADLEYMLGVVDDALILQGRSRVRMLDLRADSRNMTLPNSVRHESTRYALNARELEDANFVTGRGVVTHEAVFVPTRTALLRFNVHTGKRESDIPWPSELDGNVEGHLYVFQLPDALTAESSGNRYPGESFATGDDVELPAEDTTVEVPERRTFLALLNHERLRLIEAE